MKRLVIANRGEIARRILRAARGRGFEVAVVSTFQDGNSLVREEADAVLEVKSYLDATAMVAAAKSWGARYLHPGYGFLSENGEFARLVESAGIVFVGPMPDTIDTFGSKILAKELALRCGIPTSPRLTAAALKARPVSEWAQIIFEAGLSLPLLVKASAGGGGRGMRVIHDLQDLPVFLSRCEAEAESGFGDGTVFIERFFEVARHIEVQIFGDGHGRVVTIGDRECSLQRRYQKVIEEAPAPFLDPQLRVLLYRWAQYLGESTRYRSAGTVEFLVSGGEATFLEVNTRIQVEHTVTEQAYGIDLVEAQLELSEGIWPASLSAPAEIRASSVAIEARLQAEDCTQGFGPSPGTIVRYCEPSGYHIRVDSGVAAGSQVCVNYDSLLAKVIAWGPSRAHAREALCCALQDAVVHGVTTNQSFLLAILRHPDFSSGRISTRWLEDHVAELNAPHLSVPLCRLLGSEGFCERLSLLLCGGLSYDQVVFAERFAALSNSYLSIGSTQEELPWRLDPVDPTIGLFCLSGAALKGKGLDLVATRLSPTTIALTCAGETFVVESPRHVVRVPVCVSDEFVGPEVLAPMAGRVVEVCVHEAESVKRGQLLFVIESMKMQFDIRAERDAIVERLHVVAGQSLPGPDVLATLTL